VKWLILILWVRIGGHFLFYANGALKRTYFLRYELAVDICLQIENPGLSSVSFSIRFKLAVFKKFKHHKNEILL
jgi:hypothetical protein